MAHILCVKRAIHRCNVSVYQQYTLWHEKIATYTRFPRCGTPCHDGTGEKIHAYTFIPLLFCFSCSVTTAQLLLFLCSARRSPFAYAIKPNTHTHTLTSSHLPNPFVFLTNKTNPHIHRQRTRYIAAHKIYDEYKQFTSQKLCLFLSIAISKVYSPSMTYCAFVCCMPKEAMNVCDSATENTTIIGNLRSYNKKAKLYGLLTFRRSSFANDSTHTHTRKTFTNLVCTQFEILPLSWNDSLSQIFSEEVLQCIIKPSTMR